AGDVPTEEIRRPGGERQGEKRHDVIGGHRAQAGRDGPGQQARARDRGHPGEIDPRWRPEVVREERVEPVGERKRPPFQEPDEEGRVRTQTTDIDVEWVSHDPPPHTHNGEGRVGCERGKAFKLAAMRVERLHPDPTLAVWQVYLLIPKGG